MVFFLFFLRKRKREVTVGSMILHTVIYEKMLKTRQNKFTHFQNFGFLCDKNWLERVRRLVVYQLQNEPFVTKATRERRSANTWALAQRPTNRQANANQAKPPESRPPQ